jgi:RNA polymerase sigma factor (sigma-70 family)
VTFQAATALFPTTNCAAAPAGELEEAMRGVVAGDAPAFRRFYRISSPRISAFLVRLGADRATAEDLVHETLLRMYAARGRYRQGENVLAWARTIARRLYVDRLRQRVTAAAAHEAFFEELPRSVGLRAPDELLALRRLASSMAAVLDELPAQQAEAFRLVHEEGLSVPEASRKLGTTAVCLRLRSFRACKALRAAVDADALRR